MSNPLISIVIPAYNYARYLGICIDSVIAQTYPHWELIVIDNGSTDGTAEVLTRYNDPRIKKLKIEVNEGPVKAWAMGYEMSRGDYFALLPADDVFTPRKLERQVELLRTCPEGTCIGTYVDVIDDNGRSDPTNWMLDWVNRSVDYNDLSQWYWKHHFCIPTALYPKAFCEAAGGIPLDGLTNICDWDFHIRLLGAGAKFVVIPEKLTLYRWHSSNTSKRNSDAHNQWMYSYTQTFIPAIERVASDRRYAEIAACLEGLFMTPHKQYFLEDVPRTWRCAHLEALLDPTATREAFKTYKEFRDYTDTWEVNTERRAAIAALEASLMQLRGKLLAKQFDVTFMQKKNFPLERHTKSGIVKFAISLNKVILEIGRGARKIRRAVATKVRSVDRAAA